MYSTDGEKLIAPRRCSPRPGRQASSGSPSRARFTFPDEPRNRYRRTSSTNWPSSAPGSTRSRNVTRGSALERTASASSVSPDWSVTPTARPPRTSIDATAASVRISAPSSRAAEAIARLTPPVPPRGMPQARKAPSISPM